MNFPNKKIFPFLLVLLGFLAYCNAPFGEYVFDDTFVIRDNKVIESWSGIGTLFSSEFCPAFGDLHYRPVSCLTFFIDGIVFQKNPILSRFLNILCHIALCLLLYKLWIRLFNRPLWAFSAAAIFVAHPITTEVVNCPVFRRDIIASLLTLVSLWCLLDWMQHRSLWKAAAAAAVWFLALLTKEPSVLLVLLAPLSFWVSPPTENSVLSLSRRLLLRHLAIVGSCFALSLAAFLSLYRPLSYHPPERQAPNMQVSATAPSAGHSYTPRTEANTTWPGGKGPVLGFLNFCRTFSLYARLWILPVGLSVGHFFEPSPTYADPRLWYSALWFGSFAAVSLFLFWRGSSDQRIAGFGGLWVCICMAPIAQILPSPQILAERYLYLAHAGMALVFTYLLLALRDALCHFAPAALSPRRSILILGILVFASLAGLTIYRNRDWKDDVTLNIRRYELWDNAPGELALGSLYFGRHDLRNAEDHFLCAIRLDPRLSDAYRNYGISRLKQGDSKTGESYLRKALALDPANKLNHLAIQMLSKAQSGKK